MNKATYNGWTNYETFIVNLWMDNDEGAQRHWAAQAQDAWDEAAPTAHTTREEEAVEHLGEAIKELHMERLDDQETGVFNDLLQAAIQNVNWFELARNLLEGVEKNRE